MERYSRQVILKGFGNDAQEKLLSAKVLVIGAGGLGCPALLYLAGAGIGTLGIVDHDLVSLSNLHRQVLFSTDDIGLPKVTRATGKLHALNPEITIQAYFQEITTRNALDLIDKYDYVIDGTDNFSSRYLINDACALMNKPLIYGAVSQYQGQVAIFNVTDKNGLKTNYRDIFPLPPQDGEIPNCAEAGVLGVVPGIIGTMQAAETVKLITGIGSPLINRLLTYNVLNNDSYTLELEKNPASNQYLPASRQKFENNSYGDACSFEDREISEVHLMTVLDEATLVDVREPGEIPDISRLSHLHIPLTQLESRLDEIKGQTIVFLCQSGVRSKKALDIYLSRRPDHSAYSLKGGIRNLKCVAQWQQKES